MCLKRGLRIDIVSLTISISASIALNACGAKKKGNEGFPQTLAELSENDYEDGFWKLLRESLGVPKIEGGTLEDLIGGLFDLPSYLLDDEEALLEVARQSEVLLATGESTVCAEIKTPLVDLNPGSAIGSIDALSITNGVPASLEPLGAKVYLMGYKLKGDTEFRQALVTVPKTAPAAAHATSPQLGVQSKTDGNYGYPILMYGHAGIGGVSYTEIASSLGTLQRAFIIAAPAFPGEPVCQDYDSGTTTCTRANKISDAIGTSLPYENDVTDYLGLHDCMKVFASGAARAYLNPTTGSGGTEDLGAKIVKINLDAQTALASLNPIAAEAAGSPIAVAAGIGRGAAVAGLALARAGSYNAVFSGSDTAAMTTLASKGIRPSMFSCSLLAAPQASFISGPNRLLLESWVRDGSNVLDQSSRDRAEFVPGFSAIHANIKAIRDKTDLAEADKVAQIKAYLQKIDLVNSSLLMQVGVQNFGKVFTSQILPESEAERAKATKAAANGSILLIHGTQDKVANIGNSALLSSYGASVSSLLSASEKTAGTHWLALGIAPPAASVNESGDLPATDLDHVNSPSFINGLSVTVQDLESNVETENYVSLTPSALISSWASTLCKSSMDADPTANLSEALFAYPRSSSRFDRGEESSIPFGQ